MAQLKPVRPRPRSGSLADQVRAIADRGLDERGGKAGARNDVELESWCAELAERVEEFTAGDQSARLAEAEEGWHTERERAQFWEAQIGQDAEEREALTAKVASLESAMRSLAAQLVPPS